MPLPDQYAELGIPVKQNMHELAETFVYCFTMELNRLSQVGADTVADVLPRWQSLIGRRKPYFMFGPTQLNDMSAILFGDSTASSEHLTDFVMSLTVSLQAHLIRNGQDIMDLCRDLTDSLMLLEENASQATNTTADVFAERLPSKDMTLKTLKANRWLLTILLAVMFVPEVIEATNAVLRTGTGKKPQQEAK
jgi:hypothetical protein